MKDIPRVLQHMEIKVLSDDSWHLHAYYWHRQVPPMKPSAAENPGKVDEDASHLYMKLFRSYLVLAIITCGCFFVPEVLAINSVRVKARKLARRI